MLHALLNSVVKTQEGPDRANLVISCLTHGANQREPPHNLKTELLYIIILLFCIPVRSYEGFVGNSP